MKLSMDIFSLNIQDRFNGSFEIKFRIISMWNSSMPVCLSTEFRYLGSTIQWTMKSINNVNQELWRENNTIQGARFTIACFHVIILEIVSWAMKWLCCNCNHKQTIRKVLRSPECGARTVFTPRIWADLSYHQHCGVQIQNSSCDVNAQQMYQFACICAVLIWRLNSSGRICGWNSVCSPHSDFLSSSTKRSNSMIRTVIAWKRQLLWVISPLSDSQSHPSEYCNRMDCIILYTKNKVIDTD